jgi:uncharacterized protein
LILCDVNVLVYAHKTDAPRHEEFRGWLTDVLRGDEAYGYSDHVLSSVVRIATNRRAVTPPSTLDEVLSFVEIIRAQPTAVPLRPGPRHWPIFTSLCRASNATANLVPDAYFAALAIEHGCEWITTDRGFARFPGLRWRHPLDK